MKLRAVISISVALNAALAAAWFLLPSPVPPPALIPKPLVQVAAQPVIEPPPPASVSVPSATDFRWSQIASDDLQTYRDNLLAIGCPRPTVRDIILGEINDRFIQRRQALMASLQNRYWDVLVHGEVALRIELGKPLEQLGEERGDLIREVLEQGFTQAEADAKEGRGDADQALAWLPEEKRGRLLALQQKRDQALDELSKTIAARPDRQATAEDEARRQALQKEFQDAQNELLSPDELEQLRLRGSRESLWAAGLSGFEPTADEWRKVTAIRAEFDEAMSKLSDPTLTADARRERLETLQANLDAGMREALGDRYAQYEMGNNEDFQTVHRVTQRYGLDDNVAARACQVRQTAVSEAETVRNDTTLSAEERQAALTTIQQETEHTLAATLGNKVLATYLEYGGGWLTDLNRSGAE